MRQGSASEQPWLREGPVIVPSTQPPESPGLADYVQKGEERRGRVLCVEDVKGEVVVKLVFPRSRTSFGLLLLIDSPQASQAKYSAPLMASSLAPCLRSIRCRVTLVGWPN